MKKLTYFLKYNGITIVIRFLMYFAFGLLALTLKELAWYLSYLERFVKPSLRYQKKAYNQLNK